LPKATVAILLRWLAEFPLRDEAAATSQASEDKIDI
jgi:hypothetical protein